MKHIFKYLSVFAIVLSVSCKENTSDKETSQIEQAELINQSQIERVEPPNWWIDFQNDELQLLIKHDNIANYTPSISYSGVSIEKVSKGNNSNNYLFIDLKISEHVSAGTFNIRFKNEAGEELIDVYELKSRQKPSEDYIGFNSSDAIYLITPDRFANANTNNDSPLAMEGQPELLERTIDRTHDYARHGGDIQGITQHLDYIHDLGFTAVWPQPMLTNNMKQGSYHGYAITDLYQIDPRFGTLKEYQNLSLELKEKGMKLVMDQVANHCGLEHWCLDLLFVCDSN